MTSERTIRETLNRLTTETKLEESATELLENKLLENLITKLLEARDTKPKEICAPPHDSNTEKEDEKIKIDIVQLGISIQKIKKAYREIFTGVEDYEEDYEKDSDAKSEEKRIRKIRDRLTTESKENGIRKVLDDLTTKLEEEVSDAEKPAIVELGKNIQAIDKAYKEILTVVEEYGKKYDDYLKQEDSKTRNENDLKLKLGIDKSSGDLKLKFKNEIDKLREKYDEKEEELKDKIDQKLLPQKPSGKIDQKPLPQKPSDIDLKKIEVDMAREKFTVDKTYGKQVENSFKELEDLYKKTMDKLGDQDKRGDVHILKDAYAIFVEHERTEPLKKQIELQKMLSDSLGKWVDETSEYFDVQKKYLRELDGQRISLQKLEKDKVNYNDFQQNRRAKFLEEVQFITEEKPQTGNP